MSFRLVPNSMTFNDRERRNSLQVCLISPNSVAFLAHYETRCLTIAEGSRCRMRYSFRQK